MLDLNGLILNTTASPELTIQNQAMSEVEHTVDGTDESIDKDELIDPSSFVVLFADILNTTIKNESDSNSNTPVEENLSKTEVQVASKTESIEVKNDHSMAKIVNSESTIVFLPEENDNIEAESVQQTPKDLERNIAMAWINSDGFEPPRSVSKIEDSEEEILSELEAELSDAEEVIGAILKKGMNSQNTKSTDSRTTETPPIKSQIMTPDSKPFLNSKEDVPEQIEIMASDSNSFLNLKEDVLEQIDLSNHLLSSETIKPGSGLISELKTGITTAENNQTIVQTNLIINDPQRPIETTRVRSLDIPLDIYSSQWADKFSEHIIWLGNQGIKSALIKIHPEDLGPLEISIKVVKDNASVSISSQNSSVRDIVDQALPRLREMMAEQGLNLTDVHVGADANSRQFSQNSNSAEDVFITNVEDDALLTLPTKKTQEGLIDYFA